MNAGDLQFAACATILLSILGLIPLKLGMLATDSSSTYLSLMEAGFARASGFESLVDSNLRSILLKWLVKADQAMRAWQSGSIFRSGLYAATNTW